MPFFLTNIEQVMFVLRSLAFTTIGTILLYGFLFYILRSIFRKFERDIALVTLNVSADSVLIVFILSSFKITIANLNSSLDLTWVNPILITAIIISVSYWLWQLLTQVVFYYLKKWAENTEIMWDNVLFPLLETVTPALITLISLALILQLSFGINLSGIWVAVGGASFIIGFATKDILANFFSGIVLLIDTPFQFGDVLRLENGNLGILRKIGLRVTQIYQFESHTEAYIPNSLLQSQKIVNLSRPIAPIYYSVPITFPSNCDLKICHQTMEEIILAHPDTIGDIETKLKYLDKYFNWEETGKCFRAKKANGRKRLIAEKEVNLKLEEIEENLEALVLTLQFLEKGGLERDDIETIKYEYHNILDLVGLEFIAVEKLNKRRIFSKRKRYQLIQLEETNSTESLIRLIRKWYRIRLQDPNIVDEDQYILPKIWEYQIEVLKKRLKRLLQQILNPERIETRLDDYLKELVHWLRTRFKQARSRCHDPDVRIEHNFQGSTEIFLKFSLNYYVDDIRLEDGQRGERVNSEIYCEILNHLQSYMADPNSQK